MVTGTTSSGFAFSLDEKALDNMELVDTLAEMESGDSLAISAVVRMVLGEEQRRALYEHLRTADGRVPASAVSDAVMEIFNAFGKAGKAGKNC